MSTWVGGAGRLVRAAAALGGALVLGGGLAGCAGPARTLAGGRVVVVAAAEDFWGSIASQVGGAHARVASIITNPAADPHSYEPTAADARRVAGAAVVIENGVGYDPWMTRLLAADTGGAVVVDVGKVAGVAAGGNPHLWYDPAAVAKMVGACVAALSRVDPADAAYFRSRAAQFDGAGLAAYHSLLDGIRSRYRGTPVGASESIFAPLAAALGLDLVTPPSFLRAVSEGAEVSAADKAAIDSQIAHHRIKVYVYNTQNTTPDVRAQLAECRAAGIPTAAITETLSPASASYQEWQVRQLQAIAAALRQGDGR